VRPLIMIFLGKGKLGQLTIISYQLTVNNYQLTIFCEGF